MSGFETTQWSMILDCGRDSSDGRIALDRLCRRYRAPVLAYLRRQGLANEDAEDRTQAFFAHLLGKRLHEAADPARGRFRSFLLGSLKHFLVSEHRRDHAGKRGGEAQHLPLDAITEPHSEDTPELAFEREWARALLLQATRRLREEARAAGKEPLFRALQGFLFESPDPDDYARVSQQLGMARNTVAVAVHRLRQRLQELITAEVADTVQDPTHVPDEMSSMQNWMGRRPAL